MLGTLDRVSDAVGDSVEGVILLPLPAVPGKEGPAMDIRTQYRGMVVAVGGPPHSGKSVFLAELYRQLLARRPSGTFLQRACPDGEGMWSAESDPVLVAEIRRKGSFSQEFMGFTLKSIERLGRAMPLVLMDLGGRRTAENAEILRRSTHLIVLSSKDKECDLWCEFAQAEGCESLAILGSRLVKGVDGSFDQNVRSWVDSSARPVRGEILNLDRGEGSAPYEEAISQFADWLIAEADRYSLRMG
jgi:CRISPR-associated protein Csx3